MIICQGQSPVLPEGTHRVSSIEGLRKPGELWIHVRTTHCALKDLKRELEFYAAVQNGVMAVDEHFTKMQTILGAVP